jgi:hypothetical protein
MDGEHIMREASVLHPKESFINTTALSRFRVEVAQSAQYLQKIKGETRVRD